MEYKVHFLPSDISVTVPEGATIMDAERLAGLSYEYPCGGNGTCGKCLVTVTDCAGNVRRVKSCQAKVCGNITVELSGDLGVHTEKVLTCSNNQTACNGRVCSAIRVVKVTMPEAAVGDDKSDFLRFCDACKDMCLFPDDTTIEFDSVSTLSALSKTLADDVFTFNAVFCGNTLLDIRTDDFTPLGVAFDIGTTTVACYIMSLESGKELTSLGCLNEQVKYGDDVISRSVYATTVDFDDIHNCITNQLSKMIDTGCQAVSLSKDDIYGICVVGNTCMQHIFAGIAPYSLINVPYTPATNTRMLLPACQYLGTSVNKNAKVLVLPVIAGFIGADTVGAMLAADFTNRTNTTLLLDIGTNGEMVLGNGEAYVTCSTASGPALEGAKITCGMRGASGAVDHVFMENGDLSYTTIDNLPAVGICGSGLIDLIALLITEEVILPSGRFNKKFSPESPLYKRLFDGDNGRSFRISDKVFLTQKDIREVQLAKGAMAAGIEIMSEALGITYEEIDEVLIAGAFGNYMKPESVCILKMIPPVLLKKIIPIGNAAGLGAKIALLSESELIKTDCISKNARFIELATHEHFQEKFIKQLDF